MLEAIESCEKISGNKMIYTYAKSNRIGDHMWYISDVSKFKQQYPDWNYKFDLESTLVQMYNGMIKRY